MNVSSWLMMYNKYVASSSVHVMSKSCVTWPQALHVTSLLTPVVIVLFSPAAYAIRTPGTASMCSLHLPAFRPVLLPFLHAV